MGRILKEKKQEKQAMLIKQTCWSKSVHDTEYVVLRFTINAAGETCVLWSRGQNYLTEEKAN